MAALWEHQETEVEGVHLALALAYHGLLRIPTRAETSDMTPRKYSVASKTIHSHSIYKVSLSPKSPPALSLSTIIWRYIRQFVKMDAKEALQYVYCVTLSGDQGGGVGKEQVEIAWELTRRIIVLANSGPGWEELVGGIRAEGGRFVSFKIILFHPSSRFLKIDSYLAWDYRTRRRFTSPSRHQRIP